MLNNHVLLALPSFAQNVFHLYKLNPLKDDYCLHLIENPSPQHKMLILLTLFIVMYIKAFCLSYNKGTEGRFHNNSILEKKNTFIFIHTYQKIYVYLSVPWICWCPQIIIPKWSKCENRSLAINNWGKSSYKSSLTWSPYSNNSWFTQSIFLYFKCALP